MKIIFDSKTKLKAMQPKMIIFPQLIDEAKKKITDILPYKVFDFFGMTVAEFLQLQESKLPKVIQKLLSKRKATFYDFIRVSNTFEIGTKNFEQLILDTTLEPTADEKAAQAGLAEVTTEEAMLTFLRDYYNLQSLEAAQKLTLYEYKIARKKSFNDAKFQKNMINIQKIKI